MKYSVTLKINSDEQMSKFLLWAFHNGYHGQISATNGQVPDELRAEVDGINRKRKKAAKLKRKHKEDPRLKLSKAGRVLVDESLALLNLSREQLVQAKWPSGSTEHRVKMAVTRNDANEKKREFDQDYTAAIDGMNVRPA